MVVDEGVCGWWYICGFLVVRALGDIVVLGVSYICRI